MKGVCILRFFGFSGVVTVCGNLRIYLVSEKVCMFQSIKHSVRIILTHIEQRISGQQIYTSYLAYYQNMPDIDLNESDKGKKGRKESEPREKKDKDRREAEDGYERLMVNIGKSNGFFPGNLMELVNKNDADFLSPRLEDPLPALSSLSLEYFFPPLLAFLDSAKQGFEKDQGFEKK